MVAGHDVGGRWTQTEVQVWSLTQHTQPQESCRDVSGVCGVCGVRSEWSVWCV